jgi:hypothetical protein
MSLERPPHAWLREPSLWKRSELQLARHWFAVTSWRSDIV